MGRAAATALRIASIAVLGVVAGALASLAAIGFVETVALLNDWLLISPRSRFMAGDPLLLTAATICVPAAGGLIVGVLHRYMPDRRPHGPPDIIRAAHLHDGRMPGPRRLPQRAYEPGFARVRRIGRAIRAACASRGDPRLPRRAVRSQQPMDGHGGGGLWRGCRDRDRVQRADRGNHIRPRSDPAPLFPAHLRADHRGGDDRLRRSPTSSSNGRRCSGSKR